MRVIIIGAGDVGQQMAQILCQMKNDVVVIDRNEALLEQLQERLDIMTVTGNGATPPALQQAGVDRTDLLLAVSNSSEANILACSVAAGFGVKTKIARVRTAAHFDEGHGAPPSDFGVDELIITEYECASDIMDALMRPAIKETVHFSHPDAQLVNFQIKAGSPMIGTQLEAFPRPDLLEHLRVCAVLRYGELIIPRGKTSFIAFDEVYVSGRQTIVDELVAWADPETGSVRKVIIAGSTPLARMLASMLRTLDMRVTMIEPAQAEAERAASELSGQAMIIRGEATDVSVLEEAGIVSCDAFIGSQQENESNILSCIMARRHGARKVIAVTNNLDYLQIIASMTMIDCGFSPVAAAVNNLLEHVGSDQRRPVALLLRIAAELVELKVTARSPVARKRIADIDCPQVVFALIIRGDELVPALGQEVFQVGDRVVVLVESRAASQADKLFIN
jgi:trk system potassium uptake protein TrkA